MNKRREEARTIKSNQRLLGNRCSERRIDQTIEQDDKYTKGELAEAAAILLRTVADREKTRNLTRAVEMWEESQRGTYHELHNAGYNTELDPKPPPEWPLSEDEWPAYSQQEFLMNAMTLISHEYDRLNRQFQDFREYRYTALDQDELQRAKKNKEVARRKHSRNWARANSDAMQLAKSAAAGASPPVLVAGNAANNTPVASINSVRLNAAFDQLANATLILDDTI